MFAIELNENKFAVGLKWSRLPGEKVSAEMAALSKELDLTFGFTRKLLEEDGESYVYQAALSSEKATNGLVSAAAALADLSENIILVEKINDEQYWICCINDSEVVPGGDELVGIDSVADKFLELESVVDSDEVRICVHESVADKISSESEPLQLFDIFEENDINKPLKTFSGYKIKSLKGIPVVGLLFGGFAVVLAGAAFMMTQSSGPVIVDVEPIKLPEVKIQKPKEKKKEIKKEKTQAELFALAKVEEEGWLRDQLMNEDPYQIISAIAEFTYGLPKYFSGWSASQVIYDVKRSDVITVVWTRNDLGTSLTLQNSVQNHIGMSFSLDGQSARTTHEIVGIQERELPKDIVKSIQDDPYKTAEFMHDTESMSLSWELELLSNDTPRRQKIQGIKGERESMRKQLQLQGKYFTVRGGRLNSIYVFNDVFKKSKSSVIENININLSENNWTINGKLYEK